VGKQLEEENNSRGKKNSSWRREILGHPYTYMKLCIAK